MRISILCSLLLGLLSACSVQKQLSRSAQKDLLNDPALQAAHVGISVYEPATGKWWYNWQGDKFFVPASNVKIATCYAAMKYLGDSLVAAWVSQTDSGISVIASGDPSFLHPDFTGQPLYQRLKGSRGISLLHNWNEEGWGNGWSWNDYDQAYMAERSPFPVYGNVVEFALTGGTITSKPAVPLKTAEGFESPVQFKPVSNTVASDKLTIVRDIGENLFTVNDASNSFLSSAVPFRATPAFVGSLLADTLGAGVTTFYQPGRFSYEGYEVVHSQPTDSLLKPLMHRSDNFFAEQALLMVSNKLLGFMSDEAIIDTLLKTDFKDLPHLPRWADGSGLSRYNLFTPQDFVAILDKMRSSFGMERLRAIFPAGGRGTLTSFYRSDTPFFHAKTGTLSGVVALSGFMTTIKGRELIVSVLVNNHRSGPVQVRKAVEKFLLNLRNQL